MAFAADITGSLPGLIPTQSSLITGLAAAAPARTARSKTDKRVEGGSLPATAGAGLLPIGLIREAVQDCLQDSIQDTTGALAALMADDEIVELLHSLMGRPGEKQTVSRALQDVVDAFSALAAKDGQAEDVVRAIHGFVVKLQDTQRQLSALRQKAAQQLALVLDKTNSLLTRIAETNRQIVLNGATGQPNRTAAAAQQTHLAELAKSIDFASFRRDDGSIAVFTKQGVTLATGSAVTLDAGDSGISADGIDIAAQLSGGAAHGYLHNRDIALPNVQSQLETLAQTLQSRINQVTNRAIAGADARGSYQGSRPIADPAGQCISLGGGDCEIMLVRPDGSVRARTSLSTAVRHYRTQAGLPGGSWWPVGQVVAALDRWLGASLTDHSGRLARLSADGRLLITLPDDGSLRLVLCDRRSLALQSRRFERADQPLGLSGSLALSDALGNAFTSAGAAVRILPGDSLRGIKARLDQLDGVSTQLSMAADHCYLRLDSLAGSDLMVDPDGRPDGAAVALSLLPAEDQMREDVAVNAIASRPAAVVTSRPFSHRSRPLELQGCLILRDADGALLAFQTVAADWSLERLVDALRFAADPRLTTGVISTGNRLALKIASLAQDDRFLIEGLPQGWQTSPRFDFRASGGELQAGVFGAPPLRQAIAAGATLEGIAQQVNADNGPCRQAGLRAQRLQAGNAEILDIGHVAGLPLSFAGSALGSAPGQLDLRYNLRDALGLAPAADQVVPGLANFFGLNDLFIANPADAFDSKAAIGVFTTTAVPGTALALALSPELSSDPTRLGSAATIRQISDLLCNSLNIAAAGDLARGSYCLAHYAEAIIAGVQRAARNNKAQLTYHRTLLDQMARHRASDIDVQDRLKALMALQQTYQDSTEIVAGLARLASQLRAPVH